MRGARRPAFVISLLLATTWFSGCGGDEPSPDSLPSADELVAMLPAEVGTGKTTELSHLQAAEVAAGDAGLTGQALDVSTRERDISASNEFAEAVGLDRMTAIARADYGFGSLGVTLAATDRDFDELADELADVGGWEHQGDDLLVRRPEGLEGPFEAIGRIDDGVLGFAERAKAIQAVASSHAAGGKSEAVAALARIDGPLRDVSLYPTFNTRYYPGGCVRSFAVADGLDGTGEVTVGIDGEAPRPPEVGASTLRFLLEEFGPYQGLELGSASADGKLIRIPFEYADADDPASVDPEIDDIAYGDFGCSR